MGLRSIGAAPALLLLATAVSGTAAEPPATPEPRFAERSAELGIGFVHEHFGTGEKYMPENMAPGVVIFDADGDGRLDLFFPQGAPLGPGSEERTGGGHRLYLQREDGRFEDASARAGFDAGSPGYGMGASFGDVDRDGDLDLFVTCFGPDRLYLNHGDGRFEQAEIAIGNPLWSTGAGFFDADSDGDLDLFVVGYLDFSFDNHKWCGNAKKGIRSYCHPDVYEGVADLLFRNDGPGEDGRPRFTEVGRQAGLRPAEGSKGLGVAFHDFDADGYLDAYVANDSTMNHLYLGDGRGRFREEALLAGLGFNGAGAAEASMGLEIGDLDGDGRAEVFLTHLDRETNTLYRPAGGGLFADATAAAGLAAASLPWVGFGTVFLDHDADGDLDVFVANGHIIDNVALFDPERSHRQPAQLFDNRSRPGGLRFEEISSTLGLEEPLVGRGAAAGDLDRDGDLDLVIAQNGGPVKVLVNLVGQRRRALAVRLEGMRSNPQGFGARLELKVGDDVQVREMRSSSSYLSQGPPEVTFGLGAAGKADELVVRWPSGRVDRHRGLAAGSLYRLREGEAEISSEPFR